MEKKLKRIWMYLAAAVFVLLAGHTNVKAADAVSFTGCTDNSFTINWRKPEEAGLTISNYSIETEGKIVSTVPGNQTSVTIKGLSKGWAGYVRVYCTGTKTYNNGSTYSYQSYIGSVYANTTPASIATKDIGMTGYTSLKKVYVQVSKPYYASGVQIVVYKGKKKILDKKTYSYESFKYANNTVYKFRVRAYYNNTSNGTTYYGAWSGYRYFAVPKASSKAKTNKKGATLTVYRTPGVKYYKVYVSGSKSSLGKLSKTIKVTSKKKYTVQITKYMKKKTTNYIHVIPYIKVGSKPVKSVIWQYFSQDTFK